MRSRTAVIICALCAVVAVSASVMLADKVTLANGDIVTGQIKKLDNGIVHLTYFNQPLEIPWPEVAAIESTGNLHLLLKDGQTLVGSVRS